MKHILSRSFLVCVFLLCLTGWSCGSTPSLPAVHIIEGGDTLSELSMEYYGTMVHWKRIADENDIDDPKALEIGAEIVIPKL